MLEGTSGIIEEKDKVARSNCIHINMYRLFRAALFKGGGGLAYTTSPQLLGSFCGHQKPSPVDVNRQLHATEPKST